jgi:SAM-dependent methyltransferase
MKYAKNLGDKMDISYYNYLAEDYNHKRQKPWKALIDFLKYVQIDNLDSPDFCLDIGCGNGRNFPLISSFSNHIIGLDNSIELLKLAQKNIEKQLTTPHMNDIDIQLILCSIGSIPIRPKTIGGVFMIAVIHHIKGKAKRRYIMKQIYEIVSDKGWLIVSLWRKYQKKYKWYFIKDLMKRFFLPEYKKKQIESGLSEFGDKNVPWILSKENKIISRFYHFFSRKEAKRLMNDFKTLEIVKLGGPGKADNFFFLLKKMS